MKRSVAAGDGFSRCFSLRGFSVVELAVVLVLLGLLSALAATSLRGTRLIVEADRLQQELMAFDQRVRQRAWLGGERRQVRLDLDKGFIVEGPLDAPTTQPLRWSPRAKGGPRVTAAWTPDTGWVRRGELAWVCSAAGVAPTYALELTKGEREAGGTHHRVVRVVAGASGQWIELPNDLTGPDQQGAFDASILDALLVDAG